MIKMDSTNKIIKSTDEETKSIVDFIEKLSLDNYSSIFRMPRDDGGDFVQRKELEYFATIKFDSESDLDVAVRKESLICKFFSLEFFKENSYAMQIERKNRLGVTSDIINLITNPLNNQHNSFSALKISENLGPNNYSKQIYEKIDKLYTDMQERAIQKSK